MQKKCNDTLKKIPGLHENNLYQLCTYMGTVDLHIKALHITMLLTNVCGKKTKHNITS
jgi:spore maturation protein SpmB